MDRIENIDAERRIYDRRVRESEHSLRLSFSNTFVARNDVHRPPVGLRKRPNPNVIHQVRLSHHLASGRNGNRVWNSTKVKKYRRSVDYRCTGICLFVRNGRLQS